MIFFVCSSENFWLTWRTIFTHMIIIFYTFLPKLSWVFIFQTKFNVTGCGYSAVPVIFQYAMIILLSDVFVCIFFLLPHFWKARLQINYVMYFYVLRLKAKVSKCHHQLVFIYKTLKYCGYNQLYCKCHRTMYQYINSPTFTHNIRG